jgi:hypothetical protein
MRNAAAMAAADKAVLLYRELTGTAQAQRDSLTAA